MEEEMIRWKAMLTAFFTALGTFLGWEGIMALVWVTVMALDYLSGTAAAMKNHVWSSTRAREGLWRKGGMIFVVLAAAIADEILSVTVTNIPGLGISWPNPLLPLVLAWYILTELGSILENAVDLGAAVPGWLVKFLKASLKAIDTGAQESQEQPEPQESPAQPQEPPEPQEPQENQQERLPESPPEPPVITPPEAD